jgi:hypothetical protein
MSLGLCLGPEKLNSTTEYNTPLASSLPHTCSDTMKIITKANKHIELFPRGIMASRPFTQ